ncbi:MAG TPA: hypothetical protein VN841_06845 [Bryobacteraceae bacterium]|nr:hypothetical protein [Bryobacteraceae bacterium]
MKVFLSWHRRKAKFRYPSEPVPRTAVLEPWFATRSTDPRVRVFEPHLLKSRLEDQLRNELERFAPQAIAVSWQQIEELTNSVRERPGIAPTHAVVVLHRSDRAGAIEFVPLGADDRERLWRAFHVPIFEQVIGPRGVLLATECAAHDGLHIESPGLQIDGYVVGSPCGCGRNTPRLLPSQPVERLRAAAAYAR